MSKAKKSDPAKDKAILKAIIKKLDAEPMLRFKNGNTLDCSVENLAWTTVKESFLHKTWTVDADCYLTEEEFEIWTKARAEWNGDASLFH